MRKLDTILKLLFYASTSVVIITAIDFVVRGSTWWYIAIIFMIATGFTWCMLGEFNPRVDNKKDSDK